MRDCRDESGENGVLTLAEELFLLSLIDKKEGIDVFTSLALKYGLAGAILADLFLSGKIDIQNKKVVALNVTPCDNELLDESLKSINDYPHERKLMSWINSLGTDGKKLRRKLIRQLVSKNILQEEEKRMLWVIPYIAYSQANAPAKYWSKQHLRSVVLAGEKADARTVALLSLVRASDLLVHVFTRDELKAARKRVEEITSGDEIGEAVIKIIEQSEMAASTAALTAAMS